MPDAAAIVERIPGNVAAVRAKIIAACARAGRDPTEVRLIAVTKSQGPEVLPALAAAGITDIGENRADHQALMHLALPPGIRIHAIGRVQGRQFAELVPLSDALHSLANLDHVPRLVRACAGRGTPFPVFLQVNASGEATKAGLAPEELPRLLAAVRGESTLDPVGLMTMAEEDMDETALRRCFRTLRELAQNHGLARLSMGMSQDFPIAIEEGATDIRVGTRLFV